MLIVLLVIFDFLSVLFLFLNYNKETEEARMKWAKVLTSLYHTVWWSPMSRQFETKNKIELNHTRYLCYCFMYTCAGV